MIEQLRIKCPSCGIILEVRNSKNEAVKRIVCPNCKKQLAIDFLEKEKPASASAKSLGALYYGEMRIDLQEGINQLSLPSCKFLEIKVVSLNDGSSKCIVKALTAEHVVHVNGQSLELDDEFVLNAGDELRMGDTILIYNKAGQPAATVSVQKDKPETTPKTQTKHNNWWPYIVGIVSLLLVVFLFWPSKKGDQKRYVKKPTDTVLPAKKAPSLPPVKPDKPQKVKDTTVEKTAVDYSKLKDYELELRAGKSDVKAQYELGRRWVNKKDSVNIVKGVSYLKQAANGGSSEADNSLRKLYHSLEQSANNGNSHARNLLEVIK